QFPLSSPSRRRPTTQSVGEYGIQYLSQRYFSQQQTVARNFLLINTLLVTSLTSMQILVERIEAISQTNPWYYMTPAERSTLDFIRDKLPADATVLSKYYMGNQIPAHTDSRVFFGHLLQTPNAIERQKQIAEFYGGKLSDSQALEFLQTNNIEYVYYGREEKGFVLVYPFLNLVFENGETKMYQLKI
ncbi:MAG: hypothetical protein GW947_04050, partial [Candidatus Pacebacteria bacterium]|nr:hypothetical protein [Candidatus Paceibacterota bacterium]